MDARNTPVFCRRGRRSPGACYCFCRSMVLTLWEIAMILVGNGRLLPLALLSLCLVLCACRRSTRERWIIPAGYVGWLRLDYSVEGTRPLPLEHDHYVIRMPLSARMATSSVNDPSVDDNEYYAEGSGGLRKLRFGWPPTPGYAIQHAYSQGHLHPPTNIFWQSHTIEFECVFVGTRSDFSANGRNCSAWHPGDPMPPKYPKRLVGPHPPASPESTGK